MIKLSDVVFLIFLLASTATADKYLEDLCQVTNKSSATIVVANCTNDTSVGERPNHSTSVFDDYFRNDYTSVTNLSVTGSFLQLIPEIIFRMINLEKLGITFSEVAVLPSDRFGYLRKVEDLILANNKIEILRDGVFDNMRSLRSLNLRANYIRAIGDLVFSPNSRLDNLRVIDLSFNKLYEVDAWPFARALTFNETVVDLTHNFISNFTNHLKSTIKCFGEKRTNFKIDFSANRIQRISQLTTIFVNYSSDLAFLCLYQKVANSKTSLKLSNNPFICDCLEYNIFRMFQYVDNSLDGLAMHCRKPESMHFRKYVSVKLEEIICDVECFEGCECYKQPFNSTLHILCSKNKKMTDLPEEMPPVNETSKHRAKYKIDFSGSQIAELTPRSYLYNKTAWLDLSHCRITEIPPSFWLAVMDIERLYFNDNNLKRLPRIASTHRGKFKMLDLKRNRMSCDCADRWLRGWVETNRDRINEAEGILCYSPRRLKGKSVLSVAEDDFCRPDQTYRATVIGASFAAIIAVALVALVVVLVRRVRGGAITYDAFISAATDEASKAEQIVDLLRDKGYRICYGQRDLRPGQRVYDRMSRCRHVIFLASPAFPASRIRQIELEAAIKLAKVSRNRHSFVLIIGSDEDTESLEISDKHYIRINHQIDFDADNFELLVEKIVCAMTAERPELANDCAMLDVSQDSVSDKEDQKLINL